ncbi:histidine kinase osmosensor [Mortierella antarctica]|nr:histidine kinase osmosensor [Mortierella antarctica]
MNATMDLITKHIEFGPKAHGVEVMQGIAQLIKCLKGQTHADHPETIFDDNEFAEVRIHGRRQARILVMVHNNSTYSMLKIVAAFVFGHYAFINEVTHTWHDDPKSMMNFEGSWISHSIFTVVGLALVNLLRTEQDPVEKEKLSSRLLVVRDRMEKRAKHFPTNHAAMFHLLEAEIADQQWEEQQTCLGKVMLLYEKAISAKCLMTTACKGYQDWGARGKVQWLHKTYPEIFGSAPEMEAVHSSRGLFYRPNDADLYSSGHPLGPTGAASSNLSSTVAGSSNSANSTSPWLAGSPKYSPGGFGNDAVSAAAAAIAESCMSTNLPGAGNAASSASASSSSGPLHILQNTWAPSPGSPEVDNADLDVLDFSSVIESMQVIASEIDLDLLLVKSLYVLNQSVGAKKCSVFISKNHELVLAASQGDLGRCESVNPPQPVGQCSSLFHGVINYVRNTSTPCLLTNAMDDPRFCADDYLKQRADLKTVLCAPILHKTAMVGVLYMEDFPERAFANKRMLVMNLLVQQLGISITNALLYQSVLQSETKLNGLLENMPCGIALWDATAENCQYINSSWKDMTGFSLEEIMNSGWEILTHEDELAIYAEHWRERVLAGVPCQWESRYRLKDGSFRWAIIRMLPIKSPSDNRVIQWLTVTIDIDDQRRAVQLKSNFLANMSHELRTPFSGILGMLSLLRDSSGLSHEQFEFVDMAKASCEMLIRIVDDLLNFSKLEADKVTLEYIPLCFEEIVGDVCDLLVPLASRKGLELIILFDPTLPLDLIGDPDRLKQILMNLIGNAIKFSASGNVVIEFWHERNMRETLKRPSKKQRSSQSLLRILSGKAHKKDTEVVANVDDSQLGDEIVLHCAVKDQGIGLSPEEQKMLFVSFQQTDNGTTRKYGGTGLGLSICAQLIAHMQGKVTVNSEKGQGATFTFTAKLRTSTPYDHKQSPAESARLLECYRILDARLDVIRGRRFLILSPNRQLREQITRTLQGAICVEFDDVASALESGTIKMTGTCTTGTANGMATARDVELEATSNSSSEELKKRLGASCGTRNSECCSIEGMTRFDYILVDHVLDSAELDRIYPSPTVAFILLLAPTTETLRWILPPAVKSQSEEHEEPESGQIDIGGRGRIFQQASEIGLEAHAAVGQIQRASHETSAQQNQAALAGLAGRATAAATAAKNAAVKAKVPVIPYVKRPSELFKKRKSRGPITVTRPVPCTIAGDGFSERDLDLQHTVERHEAICRPRMETTSFQVFRLIKPVRRMKILQIIYNAMNRHMQPREAEEQEEDAEMEAKVTDLPEGDLEQDQVTGVSSTSSRCPVNSMASLKRPRAQGPLDDGGEVNGEENRRVKVNRDSTLPRSMAPPVGVNEVSTNLGLNGAGISRGTPPRKASQEAMPKRARNNDALTSLLSSEERNSCRGKNVLVAEDDFVSQRLLEKQLSKLGMNVMIANNGQEAVNQWLLADRGHYTIAIFDHHMPIMDGLAATKKVRALEAEFAQEHKDEATGSMRIPIVGLSADIQQTTKESCIKAGMDEYMTKPLLTKGLALLIQRYCCN